MSQNKTNSTTSPLRCGVPQLGAPNHGAIWKRSESWSSLKSGSETRSRRVNLEDWHSTWARTRKKIVKNGVAGADSALGRSAEQSRGPASDAINSPLGKRWKLYNCPNLGKSLEWRKYQRSKKRYNGGATHMVPRW